MDSEFFKAFNASNEEAERNMGEPWKLLASGSDTLGTEYPAIAIEKLTASSRLAIGGKHLDVGTTILIRRSIAVLSGVAEDRLILARGELLRVREIERDGDDSITLLCGPAGSTIPRR